MLLLVLDFLLSGTCSCYEESQNLVLPFLLRLLHYSGSDVITQRFDIDFYLTGCLLYYMYSYHAGSRLAIIDCCKIPKSQPL